MNKRTKRKGRKRNKKTIKRRRSKKTLFEIYRDLILHYKKV